MPQTPTRSDPYRQFNFRVEIDGIVSSGFSEVGFPSAWIDVVEYREGADRVTTVRKLPGLTRYGNVVLKRGITDSRDLFDWWNATRGGKLDRRNGSIVLLDSEGKDVRRWNFRGAWPAKYDGPSLNAKGNDVAIESFELAIEEIELG